MYVWFIECRTSFDEFEPNRPLNHRVILFVATLGGELTTLGFQFPGYPFSHLVAMIEHFAKLSPLGKL